MGRLWDKGGATNEGFLRFTVGDDYLLDQRMIAYDIQGSIAHVASLSASGLLNADEATRLTAALLHIADEAERGEFTILPEQEDGHTAIEARLTALVGELGEKVHAGRSRNDQVVTMVRLAIRDWCGVIGEQLAGLIRALCACAERHAGIVMPGYTHLQRAMPSSPALWALGYAEALLARRRALLDQAKRLALTSPLGSAAGYGTPMRLDRDASAANLDCARPMAVTAVQLSRGMDELEFTQGLALVGIVLSRLGADGVLFLSREFAFAKLPPELTSGSSIMPNKVNPDLFELIRAHGNALQQYPAAIGAIVGGLGGGYFRDLQLVKGSLVAGYEAAASLIEAVTLAVEGISFNAEHCASAMSPELYATLAAYNQVKAGVPFRQAYRASAKDPSLWQPGAPDADADSADNPAYATRLMASLLGELTP